MEKKSRCWPGYEPVAGKEPHEQGSCKPKAEKKSTPAEKRFKTARQSQLKDWQEKHPGSKKSAAQHLAKPVSRTKKAKPTGSRKSTKQAS